MYADFPASDRESPDRLLHRARSGHAHDVGGGSDARPGGLRVSRHAARGKPTATTTITTNAHVMPSVRPFHARWNLKAPRLITVRNYPWCRRQSVPILDLELPCGTSGTRTRDILLA